MESSICSTSNAVTTFKVILTLFFTIQLEIVDYLSILQESADSFSQGQKLASVDNTFDYIIVGGGAAGCVLANRLSKQPEIKVLLLEKGGDPNPLSQVPILTSTNAIIGSKSLSYIHRTITQPHACGIFEKKCIITTGRGLGGSTNINALIYTRGSPEIFDEWAAITEDSRWSFENVLKFFKKSEDYHGYYESESDGGFHSAGGEWYVSNTDSEDTSPALQYFFDSAKNAGYSLVDINNGKVGSVGGYGHYDFNVKDGKRWSAFEAFLRPVLGRTNLRVYRYAKVTNIHFGAQNTATGVSYMRNGAFHKAYGSKEIVISSGTFGSAQLLMLSGIGPRKDLESLQIPVVADLPVGKTLIDHVFASAVFSINETLFYYVQRDASLSDAFAYITSKSGHFANVVSQTGYLFTQSLSAKKNNGPPNLELIFGSLLGMKLPSMDEDKDYFKIAGFVVTPKSVGNFKLRSKYIDDEPLINPNYLSNTDDLDALVEGLRIGVSLVEASPELQALGLHLNPFPACAESPLNSTEYWVCYVKYMAQSGFHPTGTCKMGPDSTEAVVDSKLRVFGVNKLRVVDGSVMPVVPNAHTGAAAVMIAEAGSSFMLEQI